MSKHYYAYKLLDDFFTNNKPKIILTEHQRKLFLKELLEHGDLDSFCQAKKAITKNGLYVSVGQYTYLEIFKDSCS
jgi:hypothetical protein